MRFVLASIGAPAFAEQSVGDERLFEVWLTDQCVNYTFRKKRMEHPRDNVEGAT